MMQSLCITHTHVIDMNIAGLKFRLLKNPILYNTAGVFIYKHKTSGKCFVRGLKNCRSQKSNNNFPMHLKQYLKKSPSEVVLYIAELPNATRELLHLSTRAAADELSERGILYRKEDIKSGIYKHLCGEENTPYTLWLMTHIATGAMYYFYDKKEIDVIKKVEVRLKSANNYVSKSIVNPNRAMHYFTKAHFPLAVCDWVIRDLDMAIDGENNAKIALAKICKNHLEKNEVILNRVCENDVLYYRNAIVKLPHQNMQEYLKTVTKPVYA